MLVGANTTICCVSYGSLRALLRKATGVPEDDYRLHGVSGFGAGFLAGGLRAGNFAGSMRGAMTFGAFFAMGEYGVRQAEAMHTGSEEYRTHLKYRAAHPEEFQHDQWSLDALLTLDWLPWNRNLPQGPRTQGSRK